ncbi:MAG TPA: hypothetical protein VJH03_23200 [Blastocatellia bacterium]|nr:hypothetical protein [Blastocatellia bacterium]
MRPVRAVFASLVAACLLVSVGRAQEKQTDIPRKDLALEIVFENGPPAYQRINPPGTKPGSMWFARFNRIADWQPAPGTERVAAVKFAPTIEGDGVRVVVTALIGRFHDKEEPVAVYVAREGEQIVVEELTKFGVVPFKFSVVKVRGFEAPLPPVTINSPSLEMISLEPKDSVLPTYKLALRNVSAKPVIAIEVHILREGKAAVTSTPRGERDAPLIEPGATYQATIAAGGDGRMTKRGFRPKPPAGILIRTVVFRDGSYEGDAVSAAHVRAGRAGRKLGLARLLSLFQDVAAERTDSDPARTLAKLKAAASAIGDDFDDVIVEELLAEVPSPGDKVRQNLAISVQVGIHTVKRAVLEEIEVFEKNRGDHSDAAALRDWLARSRAKYEEWLGRLHS